MLTITRPLQSMNGLKKDSSTEFEILSVMSGTQDNPITVGTGKGINFKNPYINAGQLQDIYNRIVGYDYLPCSVSWSGNPASESGDIVSVIDADSISHKILITNQSMNMGGGFSSEIKSVGKTDTVIQFDNLTPTEKKIKQAYTTLQEAIAEASALINGAKGGIFRMTDSDGDGVNDGFILADRQDTELPVNAKCIVANYEGIGLSKDGGRTYENAITHNGINASALNTGVIEALKYHSKNFHTFYAKDYTQADLDRIVDIILKRISPTQADFDKYDLTGNGEIDIIDFTSVKRLLKGFISEYVLGYEITIDPSNRSNVLEVKKIRDGDVDVNGTILNVGAGAIRCYGIDTKLLAYPVGSIYMSVNSTSPAELFGGTWEEWGSGRVPVGIDTLQTEFDNSEKIGGNKNLQQHNHTVPARANATGFGEYYHGAMTNASGVEALSATNLTGTGNSGNLQPYIICYMWKRVG